MKSDDLYRKLEKSLKNVIIMTVEAGIMLLFGIIITFFDAEVQKSDAAIQWGWAVCGVAAIILIAGIAACIGLSKKSKNSGCNCLKTTKSIRKIILKATYNLYVPEQPAQTIFEPAELTFQAFNRTKYF